ncbi:hypothetical protein BV22DRAFT_1053282 [Leucogyrophana mollusca]|uniref:Uncharacterized protein n=1 Tax=Leucogyrophana mollusca TaxID=85980 RepID=A0ACB8C076_9AGAM|nr:hypothetical protein BV22DRAFT_1053282 [Leucogyrophana mollusca]
MPAVEDLSSAPSSSPVRPIKRAAVTYGRRRPIEVDECDSSVTLAGPSSPAENLASLDNHSDEENMNILPSASQGSQSSATTCADDGDDLGAKESTFQFGWKRKLQEMDRKFDDDEPVMGPLGNLRLESLPTGQTESDVPSPFDGNESGQVDTVPHSPSGVKTTSDELFGGSLPPLNSSYPSSSFDELPIESPVAPRRSRGCARKVVDSDSDPDEAANLSTAAPIRKPITTHLPSPSTLSTSELDMPSEKTKLDKGKGKAPARSIPPLRFDSEAPTSDSASKKINKGKRKENPSRPKIKVILPAAPTKKERRETVLESTRIRASRPVEITRTEGPKRSMAWFLERVKGDVKLAEPQPSLPSDDPIQNFSSPQAVASLPAQEHKSLSFGLASGLLAPPPLIRAGGLSRKPSPPPQHSATINLPPAADSDDDDVMGNISTIVKREEDKQKAEETKRRLLEAKQLALQNQARGTAGDDDSEDDLEIVQGDMHLVADDEAAKRKSDKLSGARPSKAKSRQLALARPGATKSSRTKPFEPVTPGELREHLRESARSSFGAVPKPGKEARGVRNWESLNRLLKREIEVEKTETIKQKEKDWVQQGGKISKVEETSEEKSLTGTLKEHVEKGIRAREQGGADAESAEDESEDGDTEYRPDMRGSATPEPMDEDSDNESDEENHIPGSDIGENVSQMTDNDDDENVAPRHRAPLRRAPRVLDSDDEESGPHGRTEPLGRVLVPDTSVMEIQQSSQHTTQRNSESSLEEQTEDENDKENNTRLMFDRSDDKENKAVVRYSPLISRPSLGPRPGSLFGLEDGVRNSLSLSSLADVNDGMDLSMEDSRSPLKELPKEDDPFALSPLISNSPYSARLLAASVSHPKSPTPAASTSRPGLGSPPPLRSTRINRLASSQFFDEDGENAPGGFKPIALQPSFLETLAGKGTPPPSIAPLNPLGNGGFSQLFADDNDDSTTFKKPALRTSSDELSLTLDVGLQPALEVSGTLRRKADSIFEKEQDYIVEAADKKPKKKEVLYVNDHGFLTQTRPDVSSPEVYRMTPSQAATIRATQSSQDIVGQPSSDRVPLRTLSYLATQEDSPEAKPLRRLRRRSSSPLDAKAPADLEPLAAPKSSANQTKTSVFDVLGKGLPRPRVGRTKPEKSAFVAAEAEESDEDDRFGFGGGKTAEDDEEDENDDEDKVVEGLVDDTAMDEDTQRADLVQEKFREHEEEDDRKIEKLHQDAVEGKMRMKRRDRGVGFDDDSGDEDEDERNRRIRNNMYKKRKIDGDNLEALGQNEETRAFYNAYQHNLTDDDNEFGHLQQEDVPMAAVDQHDEHDEREAVSASELRARLREAAQNQETFESLDPEDTTWVDRADVDDEDDDIHVKVLSMKACRNVARRPVAGHADFEIERPRRALESDQERTKLMSWAKGQGGHRNQGTGRSAVGAAITGHARTKVKTGGGSLRTVQPTAPTPDNTSASRTSSSKLTKAASMLASVSDRSSRFA